MERRLTQKQQAFVAAYDGNGVESAKAAGYKGGYQTLGVTACRLLKDDRITRAIQAREKERMEPVIMNRQERQSFWSGIMLDEDASLRDRLRASELLGKSEGDFLERHEVKHTGIGERITRAMERLKIAQAEEAEAGGMN